jgi:hypothetical protein
MTSRPAHFSHVEPVDRPAPLSSPECYGNTISVWSVGGDRPAVLERRVADAQRLGQAELADVVDELAPASAFA